MRQVPWESESMEAITKVIIHIKEDKFRKIGDFKTSPRPPPAQKSFSSLLKLRKRSFYRYLFRYFNIFLKIVRLLHDNFPSQIDVLHESHVE